jgi:hypothetical protein
MTDAVEPPSFWTTRLGVAAKRALLGLAWLVIWSASLAGSAQLAYSFYLKPNQEEGFAAMLFFDGVMMLGPLGFMASILAAWYMHRLWPFLAGAVFTGVGTVAFLIIAFA